MFERFEEITMQSERPEKLGGGIEFPEGKRVGHRPKSESFGKDLATVLLGFAIVAGIVILAHIF